MKKIIILYLAFTAWATIVKAQNPFIIEGQLAADKQGFVILDYTSNGNYLRDSAVVHNGKFSFKGTFADPLYAMLALNPVQGYVAPEKMVAPDNIKFFIDGNITVRSSNGLKTADIRGGKTQADYVKRDLLFKPLNTKLEPLNEQMRALYKDKNTEAMKPVKAQIGELLKQSQQIDSTFISQNPDSYVAFDIWRSKHTRGFVKPEWRMEFERFSKRIKNTNEGKLMGEKIERAGKLVAGNIAPMFSLEDLSGKKVSLGDLKGKNVLLVFWNRYFVPFETFSLYMRRAEKRLKDKNTVIVGINYDDGDTWHTVAEEEFPEWINLTARPERISANEMGKTATAYGVYSASHTPAAYLIGPDGKFLTDRINLNDNELGLKLEKLLK
jgi:peroxiredoxin